MKLDLDTWPIDGNDLMVRLKFYWSRSQWLLVALLLCAAPAAAQIPVEQLQIVNSPDVKSWAPTATITDVAFWKDAGIHIAFDKNASWPDVVPPGWEGPLQYTVWLLLKVNGQWYGSGIIECWRDRPSTDDADVTQNNKIARDWLYDSRWGPMAGHQPQPGELVGFMVTNGDARGKDVHAVAERSKIVELAWPAASGSSPAFVWVEGEAAPPVVTLPPPVVTVPPPVVMPPVLSGDYTALLQQILASEAQLLDSQRQLLDVSRDTNAQVHAINKTVGQTLGAAAAWLSKYVLPAVAAFVAAKKL